MRKKLELLSAKSTTFLDGQQRAHAVNAYF